MNPDLVDMEREADQQRDPDNHRVMEGPAAQHLRDGQLIRDGQAYDVTSPRNKLGSDTALQWHPDNLRLPVDQLANRYDPEIWQAFESWSPRQPAAGLGTSIWGWLTG